MLQQPALMPRKTSCDANPTLEEVLAMCPASSLVTPAANKPVRIRALKRTRFEDGPEPERSVSPEPRKLSPRKLDMDQAVVLANPSLVPSDDELEEEEPIQATQPYLDPAEDIEEGELSSVPALLMRCESASLPDA